MFLCSPLPSWKQIFTSKKSSEKLFWENKESLLFPESCVSLRALLIVYKKITKKERILIYIPDYFCDQTIQSFREDWMDFYYYPINENLEPQWNLIEVYTKQNAPIIDFFIFVHYFGMEKNVSIASDFVKRYNSFLIEDCAHVLLPKGKIGTKGDFVLFSPHKQLPLSDGAILSYNYSEKSVELWTILKEEYNNLSRKPKNTLWYIIKIIQKILKLHKKLPYYSGVHFGTGNIHCTEIKKISLNSELALRSYYDYTELKKICYIRRDNLSMMDYLINKIDKNIISMGVPQTYAPYYAIYSLKNVADKKKAVENLMEKGFPVLYWPDLPRDIANKKSSHETAFSLSEDIITIPIHQDITPNKICKKLAKEFYEKKLLSKFSIVWNKVSKDDWENLFAKVEDCNIPQDWTYGEAKHTVEKWIVDRGIINDQCGNRIGLIQLLTKTMFGIPVVRLVNRGPLFIPEYNLIDNHLQIMEYIKQNLTLKVPIVFLPIIKWSPEAIIKLVSFRYMFLSNFGYPSGVINLNHSEEEIRSSFDSKWRNQLKVAEKTFTLIYNDSNRFNDFVDIYHMDKKTRRYKGVPDNILKYLYNTSNRLDVFYATDKNGDILGFDIFYLHGKISTYLVGWNSNEGRKKNLNNLLLYRSIIGAKKKGMSFFDLGGIEDISTETIAKFKRGTNPIEYRLCGSFVK